MSAAADQEAAPRWRELFTDGLARTTIGLLLMETLVAIQALVTIAVLPAVVDDLGGLHLYGVALAASGLATVFVLPVTPRLVARLGLERVFIASIAVFVLGSVIVLAAPTMPVFVAGRLVQGAGGGAQYALLLAIFTRRYPTRLRPRMFAAWAVAWAVPGLLGPAYGAFVASSLGWRWAFGIILPLVIPSSLLLLADFRNAEPADDASTEPREDAQEPAPLRSSVALGLGLAMVLTSLALGGVVSLVVGCGGLVLAVVSLRTILPSGSFTARFGLPAVIATAFLANTAFFAVEGFLPAFLTGVRGMRLTLADLVVTCAVLAWVVGSWFQSRIASRFTARAVATAGALLMLLGVGGVVLGVVGAPQAITYLAWGVGGFGMGVTYPTIALLATELATPGSEVVTLAQYQLAEILGSAVGPGLVGGALSLSLTAGLSLRDGLLIGFLATCVILVGLTGATRRLPAVTLGSGSEVATSPKPISGG